MESSSTALLLICMLFLSSAAPILGCGYCGKPTPTHKPKPKTPKGPLIPGPITPIIKPPHILPPITVPPVIKPPHILPPVITPPVITPPITVPPVIPNPPITVPPLIPKPPGGGVSCPTPPSTPAAATCPIDALKLGACVDLLGGLVHIGLGDPAANECCPVLQGLVELEAAVCLCTTLKIKLLNLNIFVPLALQLLVTCGKTPPPGFTCAL